MDFVKEFHGLLAYRHQGIAKTLLRIAQDYYFLGIRAKVKKQVLGYNMCIQNKTVHYTPYRFLKLLNMLLWP